MCKSVGIIPLRAGSKGILGKNKVKILGRPLYQWSLSEAIFSNLDIIYIFTDDKEIIEQVTKEYKWTDKVNVLLRSKSSASDTASTEEAMIEFAKGINYDFNFICLLQATSPLTSREDINLALRKVEMEGFDSALTVVKTKRFIWSESGDSLNYNFKLRPRRQDFAGLLVENGAIYVSSKNQFIASKNRLGGKIGIVEMPEDSFIEIDELNDLIIIEELLKKHLKSYKKNPQKIEMLVLDVDGVFTDGLVGVSSDGELFKSFSLRDGMGLEKIRNSGVEVVVITSENSPIVEMRMNKLGIKELYLGVKDKFARLNDILISKNLNHSQVAYIGDDINDIANIVSVGWGICPQNAILEIKLNSDLILNSNGGDMAIREAVEFIINYNRRF